MEAADRAPAEAIPEAVFLAVEARAEGFTGARREALIFRVARPLLPDKAIPAMPGGVQRSVVRQDNRSQNELHL